MCFCRNKENHDIVCIIAQAWPDNFEGKDMDLYHPLLERKIKTGRQYSPLEGNGRWKVGARRGRLINGYYYHEASVDHYKGSVKLHLSEVYGSPLAL